MAIDIGDLVQFKSSTLNIGDWFYSVVPRSAPTYLPLTQAAPYQKLNYTTLANILSPDITAIDYTSTLKTNPSAGVSGYWGGIGYGNGVWMIMPGGIAGFNWNVAARSIDNGVTWSTITLPQAAGWTTPVYGNGVWVAVATQGTTSNSTNTFVITSHDDGLTWVLRVMPSAQNWSAVAYGNGVWVAIAGGAISQTSVAAYSTDGITWTQKVLPDTRYWSGVAYGGGVFVAVNSVGLTVAVSNDGLTWTSRPLPGSYGLTSIAYGNGVFMAMAGGWSPTSATSKSIVVSVDYGASWVLRATLPSFQNWVSLTYGNGSWVAVSGSFIAISSVSATSTDNGLTWTERALSSSEFWSSIGFGSSTFIACAYTINSSLSIINYAVNPTTFTVPIVTAQQGATAYVRANI